MILILIRKFISNNVYLLAGVVVGILVTYNLDNLTCDQKSFPETDPHKDPLTIHTPNSININDILNVSTSAKPVATKPSKKTTDGPIRPRYYSTELGIKEKLFIGVLTSEERINTQAIYINHTIGHLVDKLKFFITAHNKAKTKFNLTGIVGFTDTRNRYRPFQIIKYITDSFSDAFDYYLLMNDFNYLNARRLKQIVAKISVSTDVYLGITAEESSFCNLDAGIIFSNSVLNAMKDNLNWCVKNAVSDDHSENLGRCVYHSVGLECQEVVQSQSLPSYKLKHFQLDKYLQRLSTLASFNAAVTVYPILHSRDFFILNAYFLQQELIKTYNEINRVSASLSGPWPPGRRAGAKPATRFDLPQQFYFNTTHLFFPDNFVNVRPHTRAEHEDIQRVIGHIKRRVSNSNEGLEYRRLINGYRTFDLSRGLDYVFDLGFRNLRNGKEVVKRFEVCKPLGKSEFVPAPYVTENVRIAILLPIQETQIPLALEFLQSYYKSVMERRDRTFLMLVLLYQYDSPSKGKEDMFAQVKSSALKLSSRIRNEDMKIIWLSVRLPKSERPLTLERDRALNFAIVDLALKKIGTESLVLILDVFVNITTEFLNRVRMNTIPNFQVFNPIPFRQYNPEVSQSNILEVNKNVGHFDYETSFYVSFYGKDYVSVRKKSQNVIPIVRSDNDIVKIVGREVDETILGLFAEYSDNIHCMRAPEKDLKVKYHEEAGGNRTNLFLGTKVQLAKLLLGVQDKTGIEL